MNNIDVRQHAANLGVKLWEIADYMEMHDSNFSRKLRKELSVEEKQKIIKVKMCIRDRFSGTPGSDTLVFTLPQRYWPSAGIYFCFFSNNIKPIAYGCRIQLTGGIRAFAIDRPDNVIGTVSYPVR